MVAVSLWQTRLKSKMAPRQIDEDVQTENGRPPDSQSLSEIEKGALLL